MTDRLEDEQVTSKATRRGFIGAVGAFVAAVSSGVKMPFAASELPGLTVRKSVDPAIAFYLKDAACVEWMQSFYHRGRRRLTLRFCVGPGLGPTPLNRVAEELASGLSLVGYKRTFRAVHSTTQDVTVELE